MYYLWSTIVELLYSNLNFLLNALQFRFLLDGSLVDLSEASFADPIAQRKIFGRKFQL